MRPAMCIPLLPLIVGAAGCGFLGGGGRTHTKQTRPIAVTLLQKKGSTECEAKFSGRPQHAFDGDDIAWEFTNACDSDQTVTLAVNPGSTNPFTDPPPWTLPPIKSGDMADKVLTVAASAPPGTYKFDIIVLNGKRYDPILEIDP